MGDFKFDICTFSSLSLCCLIYVMISNSCTYMVIELFTPRSVTFAISILSYLNKKIVGNSGRK